jgi:hypothetical protein
MPLATVTGEYFPRYAYYAYGLLQMSSSAKSADQQGKNGVFTLTNMTTCAFCEALHNLWHQPNFGFSKLICDKFMEAHGNFWTEARDSPNHMTMLHGNLPQYSIFQKTIEVLSCSFTDIQEIKWKRWDQSMWFSKSHDDTLWESSFLI